MSSSSGHLYGVGLGPGDPELITRKAARLIAEADVVAYYSGTHGRSIARSIAADLIPEIQHEKVTVRTSMLQVLLIAAGIAVMAALRLSGGHSH